MFVIHLVHMISQQQQSRSVIAIGLENAHFLTTRCQPITIVVATIEGDKVVLCVSGLRKKLVAVTKEKAPRNEPGYVPLQMDRVDSICNR